jgi:hypothetical protein
METNKKIKAFTDYLDSVNDDFLKEPESKEVNTGAKRVLEVTEYIGFANQFNASFNEPNLAGFIESKFEDLKMCLVFGRSKDQVKERMETIVLACNEYDKLKEDNAMLLESFKEIIELFPDKPKLPISHQVLEIAKRAINK